MERTQWDIELKWPERRWWSDPHLIVTILESGSPYVVAVEIHRDDDLPPFVTGVAIRRHRGNPPWRGEPTHVSPREIQRLPLSKYVKAALAAAAVAPKDRPEPSESLRRFAEHVGGELRDVPGLPHGHVYYDPGDDPTWRDAPPTTEGERAAQQARKVLVPRGRPKRDTRESNAKFYREIADAHRGFSAEFKSPVKEIARRKAVSENTVHQWIHRARQLGFLEPSPRSRRLSTQEEDRDA